MRIEDLEMKPAEACMWLRPETSIPLINKAKEKGMSYQDILAQIDQAINIVCGIAEKLDNKEYQNVISAAYSLKFPHYLCKDKTHVQLEEETLHWIRNIIRKYYD